MRGFGAKAVRRPKRPDSFHALAALLARGDVSSTSYADLCVKLGLLQRYAKARPNSAAMAAEPHLAARYAESTGQRALLSEILSRAIADRRRGAIDQRVLSKVLKRAWQVDAPRVQAACAEFALEPPVALTLATDSQAPNRIVADTADADLHLVAANAASDPANKLARINAALAFLGQSKLALKQAGQPPSVLQLMPHSGTARAVSAPGPRVSVIMTCFDSGAYLRAALESVLQQSWPWLEVVVVDDASSDDSWAIVEAAALSDARVRGLRLQENVGTYAAKNRALTLAGGDFVAFNDADDWAHPQRLEAALRCLEQCPSLVAVSGQFFRLDAHGRVSAPRGYPLIRWSTNSVVFRREPVLQRIGYFDENRFGSDSEYLSRLIAAFGESGHRRLAQVQHIACARIGSLMHGAAYGIDAMGYSVPRREFEDFWAERLLEAVRSGSGLYLPAGVTRSARLFAAAASAQGVVQHGAPVHELVLGDSR